MKKQLFTLLLLLACVSLGWSQNRRVTGTVTDGNTGETLPGVSILVKGSSVGTTTNTDGKFTINVPDKKETAIIFSFVGYLPETVVLGARSEVSVGLKTDQKMLEEVVVIGYGLSLIHI